MKLSTNEDKRQTTNLIGHTYISTPYRSLHQGKLILRKQNADVYFSSHFSICGT